MDPRQSRTLFGLMCLVVLWIVLYWFWEPRAQREPVVTFPEPAADVEPGGSETGAGADINFAGPATQEPPSQPSGPMYLPGQSGGSDAKTPPVDPRASEFGQPPFREVIARQGDTFEKIAERELGSTTQWKAIARANPYKDPSRLRPGDTVRVPIDPRNPQGKPTESEQNVPAAPPPAVEYKVQSGDTLSDISKQFYGSVRYVDFIYEANRDRLRSKNDLKVGQVLRIPAKPDN